MRVLPNEAVIVRREAGGGREGEREAGRCRRNGGSREVRGRSVREEGIIYKKEGGSGVSKEKKKEIERGRDVKTEKKMKWKRNGKDSAGRACKRKISHKMLIKRKVWDVESNERRCSRRREKQRHGRNKRVRRKRRGRS